jgi:hypothetical protein
MLSQSNINAAIFGAGKKKSRKKQKGDGTVETVCPGNSLVPRKPAEILFGVSFL